MVVIKWYFTYWLGRGSLDGQRQINRWKEIVSRPKGKLVQTIKDVYGRFVDYSIWSKIRYILLDWSYVWISWRWFVMIYFFVHIKMSYYWFNKEELLKKVSDKYHNKGNNGSNKKLLSIIEII